MKIKATTKTKKEIVPGAFEASKCLKGKKLLTLFI